MEIEKVAKLVNSLTGLDEELIKNSLANEETGSTVLKNVFSEKYKVSKIEDFELREKNLKKDYREELIRLAKEQKLPQDLYNVIANNVISKNNKTIAAEFGVEVADYNDFDAIKKAVTKKYASDETLKNDFEHVQDELKTAQQTIIDNKQGFEGQIKKSKIDIDFATALNNFNIDFDTQEQLESRRTVVNSVFHQNYQLDIKDGKTVVMKDNEVLKHADTREPLTINDVLNSEMVKYVPLKKVKSKGRDDDVPETGAVITTMEQFNEHCKANGLTEGSNARALAYDKVKDNIKE